MECDKATLRARMRACRASADPSLSEHIAERVMALKAYESARTVLCYHSVGGEVDTLKLIERMRSDGKTVCLPAIIGKGVMEARRMDRLIPGPYGIPCPEGPVVPPESIDLILVPGLAFDRDCQRLGQGGGYYDRYLPGCRGVKIGLAFDCQVVECLPLAAHDAQLDLLATETKLYIRP
jgi:5-formyltetrahydrofolate cyclo-ligase